MKAKFFMVCPHQFFVHIIHQEADSASTVSGTANAAHFQKL